MRAGRVVVVTCALAFIGGGACSGGDDAGSTSTSGAPMSADCAAFREGLDNLGSGGASPVHVNESAASFATLIDVAPEEISDDVRLIAEVTARVADGVEGVDLVDPEVLGSPDGVSILALFDELHSDEFEAARLRVTAYVDRECGPAEE